MNMRVVFTGPAIDGFGRAITRSNLVEACQQVDGLEVQSSVRADTTALVASRKDTVKARSAEERGVDVLTYPEFITRYLRGIEIAEGGPANPFTDKIDPDLLVPDFVGMDQLEALDQL